ncbi:MAG: ATP-binding protein, partial [Burkholderiaceae bacterium]
VTGIFVEGVDVSDRLAADDELRRLAARLQQEDRRKTEFLATLAHELRNPLAPLRSGLEVLRLAHGDPATAPIRDMMERQLSHMVHLVDDLMDISRISSGKILLKREQIDLRLVLEAAIETSRPLIEAKRHMLAVALGEQPLPVHVDRVRMAQVVSNLLNNAAKYTPQGGQIELAARRDRGNVLVSVKDNGIGIPQEHLESVFEMFAQESTAGAQLDGGLGVGLTLVRRITEMHGGSVSAARSAQGGSILEVRIPLAPVPDSATASDAASQAGHPSRAGLRVLVADDNIDAASSLCELLIMLGHDAREAHDGIEALRVARAFRPEIIFLDIGMPHKDGYQVARELRATPEFEHVTLVALTGWGNKDDLVLAQKAGFDHHLTKPADLSAIQKLLVRPEGASVS